MGTLQKLNEKAGVDVAPAPDDGLIKIVLPDLKLIWLWIPKNAGGSLSRALLKVHGERAIACDISLDLLRRLNPEFRSFETVAIKRNPYTRAVSCWLNKIMSPQLAGERYFTKPAWQGLRHGMPFPEFAEWLTTPQGGDERADLHWKSQHEMLQRVDRLLPFEDLTASAAVLGVGPDRLPHRNRHQEMADVAGLEPRPLLGWYDERAKACIARRYADDLEALGYDWPEPALAGA